jgi:Fe-S-cluster containining protein
MSSVKLRRDVTVKQRYPDCRCENCQRLCSNYPGWLTPRDVKRLALHLGVSMASLFRTHLSIDGYYCYRSGDGEYADIFVPLPKSERADAGEQIARPVMSLWSMFSGNESACGLLKNGRCSIHAVKPRECRESYAKNCLTAQDDSKVLHRSIMRAWARPGCQFWLASLLTEAGLDAEKLMTDAEKSEWDLEDEEETAPVG